MTRASSFEDEGMDYTYQHVTFPPNLPQGGDDEPFNIAQARLMSESFRTTLKEFSDLHVLESERTKWHPLVRMLDNMQHVGCDGSSPSMNEENLNSTIAQMSDGSILPLHIRAQNCGMIIRANSGDVTFETFELSARNEDVMSTDGRLVRSFPGPAIVLRGSLIKEARFRKPLISLLAQLDVHSIAEAQIKSKKAGIESTESRNVPSPRYVTELMTAILRAVGEAGNVERVSKRTRDEIVWQDSDKPWRRSSLWLLLRVCLQTSLRYIYDGEISHRWYKAFLLFYLAKFLDTTLLKSCPSEQIFIIMAKVTRRVLKLDDATESSVLTYVAEVMARSQAELHYRWKSLESAESSRMISGSPSFQRLWSEDTSLQLSKLRRYLKAMSARTELQQSRPQSQFCCQPRILPETKYLPTLVLSGTATIGERELWVLDIETWIEQNLDNWVDRGLCQSESCVALSKFAYAYKTEAEGCSRGRPEETSIMILTLMHLWVALDRCTISCHGLLRDYDTAFRPGLFDPLLLPKQYQMRRLFLLEQYLADRKDHSKYDHTFVLVKHDEYNSFGPRFFDKSTPHQSLQGYIEEIATIERSQKLEEFSRKKVEYLDLIRQAKKLSHEYYTGHNRRGHHFTAHSKYCKKCKLESQAADMEIDIFEWPLPNASTAAKAAVYELDAPVAFSHWRDYTYAILFEVLSVKPPEASGHDGLYYLQDYIRCRPKLSRFVSTPTFVRIRLASMTKPFIVAHYKTQKISAASRDSVCRPSGLHYALYDFKKNLPTSATLVNFDVRTKCTPILPPGPYQYLQSAIASTDHLSNGVLASQSESSDAINLHEYYAFAMLRSGPRLQWRNIARELVAKTLNFNCIETYILIQQASSQAGGMGSDWYRECHVDLNEAAFNHSLVQILNENLDGIANNWQGCQALRTFVRLAVRCVSLTPSPNIRQAFLVFLQRAKDTSNKWIGDLLEQRRAESKDDRLEALRSRVLEAALSYVMCFDLEIQHVETMLHSPDDVASLLKTAILIQSHSPSEIQHLPKHLQYLLRHRLRISQALETFLRGRILQDRRGIDRAIADRWAGYVAGNSWQVLESPNERWIRTQTCSEDGRHAKDVDFNLLSGELLVDGMPLTRLPEMFEKHHTFTRLFGSKVLSVLPSTRPMMTFETESLIHGYQIHFAMVETELVIQAISTEHFYELVPQNMLIGAVPHSFAHDYFHWLDLASGTIEWRPRLLPWTRSVSHWHLCIGTGDYMSLHRNGSRLLDIQSSTAKAVTAMFQVLEDRTHIHTSLREGDLAIQLPRLKLDFYIKKDHCEVLSGQFRGMRVATEQTIGAWTGLQHKLILVDALGKSRIAIVPKGEVSFKRSGDHVCVEIATGSERDRIYHKYIIDQQLGRIVDSGRLFSRLFRAYLHALTSHCLADSLTGRTGTEEALCILRSAATFSFQHLDEECQGILLQIARLNALRRFYPQNLQVMQCVTWQDLPILSHHENFVVIVGQLFRHHNDMGPFHGRTVLALSKEVQSDEKLLQKALIRNSTFRIQKFGAETFTNRMDTKYNARDCCFQNDLEKQTYSITKMVTEWTTCLNPCTDLLGLIESWQCPLVGPDALPEFSLEFEITWLTESKRLLPEHWCALQIRISRCDSDEDRYKFLIFLACLSYTQKYTLKLLHTLLALATVPKLRTISPPRFSTFDLSHGYTADRSYLYSLSKGNARPIEECPEINTAAEADETEENLRDRRNSAHVSARETQLQCFIDATMSQWPTSNLNAHDCQKCRQYLQMAKLAPLVNERFVSWFRNSKFKEYIQSIQIVLNEVSCPKPSEPCYTYTSAMTEYTPIRAYLSIEQILAKAPPPVREVHVFNVSKWLAAQHILTSDGWQMQSLLSRLSLCHDAPYEMTYLKDLQQSLSHLNSMSAPQLSHAINGIEETLTAHLEDTKSLVLDIYQDICEVLRAADSQVENIVVLSGFFPRLSPMSLLQLLSKDNRHLLSESWNACLISYAFALSTWQRAERLVASIADRTALLSELASEPYSTWSPREQPDWILFEIENNITIRASQSRIASEMISPSSGRGSVMQLNMGEGKSSVIVPIISATLADGNQLVRVVALKALSNVMFTMLVTKLGGLLNRQIYYLPISRALQPSLQQARQIQDLYKEIVRKQAILLLQPEHLLSFELMGPEHLISEKLDVGRSLVSTNNWLKQNSRDVLDESDEILSVSFELIYSIGLPQPVEFSPDRWNVIQDLLGRIANEVVKLSVDHADDYEVVPASIGSLPRIRVMSATAGKRLTDAVVKDLCERGSETIPLWRFGPTVRDVVFRYVTGRQVLPAERVTLRSIRSGSDILDSGLLLLKGLVSDEILTLTLKEKRWRVNYGLDLPRSRLAVPYRAKDIPALRAEFSHPDVTIVLTCLSYYYCGLSDEELRRTFESMLLRDDASEIYLHWIEKAPDVPTAFRQLSGVNLSDTILCSQILFPHLRSLKTIVDYYLSAIVFPKEMREFPRKLSSSAWDLSRTKTNPTTGFSGTNDSRYILPLTIHQHVLKEQLHTNALVMSIVLRQESTYSRLSDDVRHSNISFAHRLLRKIVHAKVPIRVILDVGAQILELTNLQVAKAWLEAVPDTLGAVFFNEENQPVVLTRDQRTEALMTSALATQMDKCLVYLDESHTRGTDLKLPIHYRAAVTLGPKLTKDRLVQGKEPRSTKFIPLISQACMRMRQLGKGQSVEFFATDEIHRKILECVGKSINDTIDVTDMLFWSIFESFAETRRLMPLWATQGVRYQLRDVIWSSTTHLASTKPSGASAQLLLEPEARTLLERYGDTPSGLEELVILHGSEHESLSDRAEEIKQIRAKCQDFGILSLNGATLQEEQERELCPETERETHVERPPKIYPHEHRLHAAVEHFVETGALERSSTAFLSAFSTLSTTSVGQHPVLSAFPNDLVVTNDFSRTVKAGNGQYLDSFLRPVHWIISTGNAADFQCLIVSPFEANELVPRIRNSKIVRLHVYSPKSSLSMQNLDDLRFCSIPEVQDLGQIRTHILHTNLFSGQMYFQDIHEYHAVCRFLGVCWHSPKTEMRIMCDGFVDPSDRSKFDTEMSQICTFPESPVVVLKALLAMRRKGQSFESSHIGKLLYGRLLTNDDFAT